MRTATDRREKCAVCFFRRLSPNLAAVGLRLRAGRPLGDNSCDKCREWLGELVDDSLLAPDPVAEAECPPEPGSLSGRNDDSEEPTCCPICLFRERFGFTPALARSIHYLDGVTTGICERCRRWLAANQS